MLGLYLAAFAFGGILLGVSVLVGAGDHDLDHGLALDAEAPEDVGGASGPGPLADGVAGVLWIPFLSLRFWTFGTAAFGFVGAVLHLLGSGPIALGFAVVAGLSIGSGAAWFFRYLARDTITGAVDLARWVGREARVVLPVRPGGLGKIAIEAPEGRIELVARTRDERPIDVGRTVLIAGIEDGTADVTSVPEL